MDSEKEAQKPAKRLKRVVGSYATQKSPKKPKVMKSAKDVTEEEAAEYEKEKEELRLSLKIISKDDNEVNYEPLSGGDIQPKLSRIPNLPFATLNSGKWVKRRDPKQALHGRQPHAYQ
ncbi:hypothetical protein Tco_1293544 [Tanacetum coccineum]